MGEIVLFILRVALLDVYQCGCSISDAAAIALLTFLTHETK